MNACGGVDVQVHVFLTSALVGGEWSASRPGRFTPRRKSPRSGQRGENSWRYRDSDSEPSGRLARSQSLSRVTTSLSNKENLKYSYFSIHFSNQLTDFWGICILWKVKSMKFLITQFSSAILLFPFSWVQIFSHFDLKFPLLPPSFMSQHSFITNKRRSWLSVLTNVSSCYWRCHTPRLSIEAIKRVVT
jgi:hypothetical protein